MADQSNFLLNLSVLYRNTQKYFDRALVPYDIGSGQLIFLLCINENEGITMQELTSLSEVDKGTTTKSIQRLIDQGYIQSRTDEKDHRVKRLYTTEKAAAIMPVVYEFRNRMRTILADGVDFRSFEQALGQVTDNAREKLLRENELPELKIGGMQKMTLLDYPGRAACTIFLSGCNFKCPFCHNRDLVFIPEGYEFFEVSEVLAYLEKRKGILDGVCISGGEPLLQENLQQLIEKIRDLGYQIKLDTNGGYPERLKDVVNKGLVDYVAMDIKNSPEKYARTLGMNPDAFNIETIRESVEFLKTCGVEHEFRTTVVRELHTAEDLIAIGEWIGPDQTYYLQQFVDSGNVIQSGFTAYTKEEMEALRDAVAPLVPSVTLRGIREG
ncbi:MAG: anaerobic ribonucleoside-triphosphate reductase activating protein [Erysipelotrichaceae bacterium]|jgi:anaerobic ribonucleoside-triphosphate reductase activating protein|nr:anaerobic ribonucleoside-triphosphate reductase activating protein [Erysipelotrichaceae bacterium]